LLTRTPLNLSNVPMSVIRYSLIFLIFSACVGEKSANNSPQLFEAGQVILTGQVLNIPPDANQFVSLRFGDVVLAQGEYYYAQRIDTADGSFEFRFRIFHPKTVHIDYQEKTLSVFVFQGDSLHLTVEAEDFSSDDGGNFPSARFSGTRPGVNEVFQEYQHTFQWHSAPPAPEGQTAAAFHQAVVDTLQASLRRLEAYHQIHRSPEWLRRYSHQYLTYTAANNLLYFPYYQATGGVQAGGNIYADSVLDDSVFPLSPPSKVYSHLYAVHAFHTATGRFRTPEIVQTFVSGNLVQGDLQFLAAFQRNVPDPETRQVMSFMLLRQSLNKEPQAFAALWDSVGTDYVTQPVLQAYLQEKRAQLAEMGPIPVGNLGSDGSITGMGDENFLEALVKKHPGKVLYVDIWGTWCGPCIRQFPHSLELHERLQGEPVEFVYLCLDPDPARWKRLIKQFNLKGDHYYLGADQSRLLKQQLGFTGIPRYLLIDPQGNLVDANAPQPGETPRIMEAVRGLLGE